MDVWVQTAENPQPGDPVQLLGWEGGERGPELVKYLPGATPPLMVVWTPGRSGFYDRGRTKYYPAEIYVFQLDKPLEQLADRPLLYRAQAITLISFHASRRKERSGPRSY